MTLIRHSVAVTLRGERPLRIADAHGRGEHQDQCHRYYHPLERHLEHQSSVQTLHARAVTAITGPTYSDRSKGQQSLTNHSFWS